MKCIQAAMASDRLRTVRPQLAEAVLRYHTAEQANEGLARLTGIRRFFPSDEALHCVQGALRRDAPLQRASPAPEMGDFQTPPHLARAICQLLASTGISPDVLIEPTFGIGNLVMAALDAFPGLRLVHGVELRPEYGWVLKLRLLACKHRLRGNLPGIRLVCDDIFTHRFPPDVFDAQHVLVLGNPPWVTNAGMGALGAGNLPVKRNIKGLRGLDAITGKGNFDTAEFVLLRLLELFAHRRGTLALLCKNSVVRNLVQSLPRFRFPIGRVAAYQFNARREFGAAVDASLLLVSMGAGNFEPSCEVRALARPHETVRCFGWVGDRFVSDIDRYRAVVPLDGRSPFEWRQGVKHDCAPVMELTHHSDCFRNGSGEPVNVEPDRMFPLLKSSDLREPVVAGTSRTVILPQYHIGEDTAELRTKAPRLWEYLNSHAEDLAGRRSSIYRNRAPFAIFGIGDYSFKPFKVAVSGFHRDPLFCVVPPIQGRPVMLDDTCYFLGFDTPTDALLTAAILNSETVGGLLRSLIFPDAKRPCTKEVLMRIDLARAASCLSFHDLSAAWHQWDCAFGAQVSADDFDEYRRRLGVQGEMSAHQLALAM
ncbi:MAG: SAM-dependent methyltransferase [Armatimonadetes bacterium]|nr:SAM-dependent methyltransferase [Armatimonadota bacterium]